MSRYANRQRERRVAFVLMAGAVLIWIGLAIPADGLQFVGVAVCVGGFVRMAIVGWRASRARPR